MWSSFLTESVKNLGAGGLGREEAWSYKQVQQYRIYTCTVNSNRKVPFFEEIPFTLRGIHFTMNLDGPLSSKTPAARVNTPLRVKGKQANSNAMSFETIIASRYSKKFDGPRQFSETGETGKLWLSKPVEARKLSQPWQKKGIVEKQHDFTSSKPGSQIVKSWKAKNVTFLSNLGRASWEASDILFQKGAFNCNIASTPAVWILIGKAPFFEESFFTLRSIHFTMNLDGPLSSKTPAARVNTPLRIKGNQAYANAMSFETIIASRYSEKLDGVTKCTFCHCLHAAEIDVVARTGAWLAARKADLLRRVPAVTSLAVGILTGGLPTEQAALKKR